jgi:molybdenum cofactor cytidylyltransferase
MKNGRVAAIIVSAGYSSRMGSFKPFLKFGEYTAIETVINTFKSAGVEDIILVAGYRGNDLIEKYKNTGVICVLNKDYSKGMYSSIMEGIKALDEKIEAFFVHPVDIPLMKKYTLDRMKDKFFENGKGIIYPTFLGKMGHPPLIDCRYKQSILSSDGEGGLKRVLEKFSGDSICVPIFDEAILMDMDTKEDYENLLSYFYLKAPNWNECYALLNEYNVPDKVIKHSAKVAGVSMDLMNCISRPGYYKLNSAAIEAAALLHDIAKGEKNHALKGAEILKEIGYENVGYIISTHIDIEIDENADITENEILYLADKLVKEDTVVSLADRRCQCLSEYSDNFEASEKIKSRYDTAEKIIKKIEKSFERGFIYGKKHLPGKAL